MEQKRLNTYLKKERKQEMLEMLQDLESMDQKELDIYFKEKEKEINDFFKENEKWQKAKKK